MAGGLTGPGTVVGGGVGSGVVGRCLLSRSAGCHARVVGVYKCAEMASGAVGEIHGTGVAQLVRMGFDEPAATQAMSGARGDINRALSTLVGEEQPQSPPPAPPPFSFAPVPAGAEARDIIPFYEAFYRSARRGHADGTAARRVPSSEAAQPGSFGSFFPMLSLRTPTFSDVHAREHRAREHRATRQARRYRRPPANSEEHEAARQRILAEAAAEAAAEDAVESARGASQGTRGSHRRRQEQRTDSERPTRRQRTSPAHPGDEDNGSEFRYRSMFHLPQSVLRPPSPASVERASGGSTRADVGEREPPMAPRAGIRDRDDARFFQAGPFRPFRVFRQSLPSEEAPPGMPSGLPFAFVFEIAQEVMRVASYQQPASRGAKQEVIDGLPTINGCPDDACLICQEDFAAEERPTCIPCGHAFHPDCLKPWLSDHNTCPTCRYELETDDEEYNRRLAAKRQKQAQQGEKRGREETHDSSGTVPAPLRSRASEHDVAVPADAPATATTGSRRGDGSNSTSVANTLHRRALAAVAVANLQRSTAELRRAHEQLREQLRTSQRRQRRRGHSSPRRARHGSDGAAELEPTSGDQQPSRNSLPVSPIAEAPTANASYT